MASEDVDISQLSESQQAALQQYTAVTASDIAAAISLLRRSEWNAQVRSQTTTHLVYKLILIDR
jgi:FAS-associated factor 2